MRRARRDEHDRGRPLVCRQSLSDLEAVQIRELHIEQHQIRTELADCPSPRVPTPRMREPRREVTRQ
jgi:hypothetical protein